MESLDKLVLPHSGPNLELLKYLLILAQLIFLIFSGTLLGSTLLSLITGIISRRLNNIVFERLSVDYIDLILSNRVIGVGLGFVPLLSVLLIYIQLLHNSGTYFVEMLLYSSALYIVSYILLIFYRSSLQKTFNASEKQTADLHDPSAKVFHKPNLIFGLTGLLFLFVSLWLFTSIIAMTLDTEKWMTSFSVITILSSLSYILEFLIFLVISLTVTVIALLVKTFYWDKADEMTDEYISVSIKLNLTIALISTLLLPTLLVVNSILTPENTITSLQFALIFGAVLISFILAHLLYANLKTKLTNYATLSFYLILTIFTLFIIKEQSSFDLASRNQVMKLSHNYDIAEAALLEKQGKSEVKIDGGEIYQAKCIACHKFDLKFVGPSHKDALIKYKGREEDMIKFILNPVKVDPAYPPMPSQGLTPKEAKAVVEYMFKHYADQIK